MPHDEWKEHRELALQRAQRAMARGWDLDIETIHEAFLAREVLSLLFTQVGSVYGPAKELAREIMKAAQSPQEVDEHA